MARPPKNPSITPENFGAEVDAIDDEVQMAQEAAAPATDVAADFTGELTAAEKQQIEAEARREVSASIKAAKMKEYKAHYKKQVLAQAMFGEGKDDTGKGLIDVELDLASYPKWIMLDGKRYHSGRTYRVKAGVAAVLFEQMARGWDQEAARRGEKIELMPAKRKTFGKNGMREEHIYH